MTSRSLRSSAFTFARILSLCLLTLSAAHRTFAQAAPLGPFALTCDSLDHPIGIDSTTPVFSWKLHDPANGARQSAYEILVSSKPATNGTLHPDIWDSGRISSDQSLNIPYAGKPLTPSTRYFWQVRVWNRDNHLYPASPITFWETGLMDPSAWHAQWIGYEQPELASLRRAGAIWITNPAAPAPPPHTDVHHNFRLAFNLTQPIQRAVLYTTGQDTAAAWINGTQVLNAQPLTPYKQMPWKTWVSADVTPHLTPGNNSIAIDITHFFISAPLPSQSPMSMALYLLFRDGSSRVITSADPAWKAALNSSPGWQQPSFNDTAWPSATPFRPRSGPMSDGDPGNPIPTGPVVLLRHTFQLTSPIVSARLYATALGAYKFHINGKPIGDQILSPGWMDFREHVPYQVYDVTSNLRPGVNAIASYLAPGWYSTPLQWFRQSNNYGNTPPALKAQLRLQHADGSIEWISTDSSWRADISPILFAEIYDGETYDARRVQPHWDTASFNDARWSSVQPISPSEPRILAQTFPPIREEKVLTAKAITTPAPGVFIYDFGQNLAGVPRILLSGKRGTDVRLRFAEVLNSDGTLYTDNLRTAKATDHFILAGSPTPESYQPQFTYHGFRYIEVTGLATRPSLAAIQTVVFHTDAPFTTTLDSGSPMVNKLWSNILWGQRSNFIGVPTDCPQRDERLGWTADAQVFWRTAAYNMDLSTFTRKFSADLRGTQVGTSMYGIIAPGTSTPNDGYATGWSDAGVIIPWTGWIQSGNPQIIDENWDAMESYLRSIRNDNPDFLWRKNFGIPFGDWLTPTQTTPEDLIATAYWAYDVSLMQQMALATGRSAQAAEYAELFQHIKSAFIHAYVHPDGFIGTIDHFPSIPPPTITPDPNAASKPAQVVETQTAYVLALYIGLVPDDLRPSVASHLVDKIRENHWLLGTGFLGTPFLLEVLSDTGHSDIAYRLLLNRDYPSWGYLIDHGATTTWERWNGDQMRNDPSMNSYNHYAYGAVAAWIYRYAAGIDTTPANPGFHTLYLHPNFDPRLGRLRVTYDSPYGTIASAWHTQGHTILWTLTIPPNASAILPTDLPNTPTLLLDGAPLASSPRLHLEDAHTFRLPSGTYHFTASIQAVNP